jgi:hypothetical protein
VFARVGVKELSIPLFSIGNCVEELEGNSLLVEDIYMQNYIIRGNPCRNKFPRL